MPPRSVLAADPKNYITAASVVTFLQELLRHLRGRVIVVWDGGTNHQSPLIRALCARHPRLHLEWLPAYAPDHNPVESLWSYLKHARLPNFVPASLSHLDQTGRRTPGLLKALWHGSKLPFPPCIFA